MDNIGHSYLIITIAFFPVPCPHYNYMERHTSYMLSVF